MTTNFTINETKAFAKYFTPAALFEKVKDVYFKIGVNLLYMVCLAYYTMMDEDTPVWAKGILAGGLGYFICPIDFIPDVIPFTGFSDDAMALAACLFAVAVCLTPRIKERAKAQVRLWLGVVEDCEFGRFA